jgi:SAM-dependent methyltransferase
VCPRCRADLRTDANGYVCAGCDSHYAIREDIPMLAVMGADGLDSEHHDSTSAAYQQNYQELAHAAEYNRKYEQRLLKRWNTRREWQLLGQLLGSRPRSSTLLELPCGGGRLSPPIAAHTDLLIEADVGLGQILYGRRHGTLEVPRIWMTASAFHIPFRDDSVDGVVCVRLCHHLPTVRERRKLVRELLRVARRFVIMTFFDHHSPKNLLRRARQRFDHKPAKNTMSMAEVADLAREAGGRLERCPPLSLIGSGHRYALMTRA